MLYSIAVSNTRSNAEEGFMSDRDRIRLTKLTDKSG